MRLPESVTKLEPVGAVLEAALQGEACLHGEVEQHEARWLLAQADAEGLSRWEAEFGLPDWTGVDLERRRNRLLPLLCEVGTLTPRRLEELAVTVGGAEEGVVEEHFSEWKAELTAFCTGKCMPEEQLQQLRGTVDRLQPAHLEMEVVPGVLLKSMQCHALTGGMLLEVTAPPIEG